MADIKTNLNGDIKTIDYEVNSDIDESDFHMMAMVQRQLLPRIT